MGTLNSAWNIATGALSANQSALNVVANNTANANTPGYTRETPTLAENDSVYINGHGNGTGVSFVAASSQRDRVLEQSLQQQTAVTSASTARLTSLGNVEAVFSVAGSSGSSGGIASAISSFYNSLASLESGSSDTSLRQQVISTANTLAQSVQDAAASLNQQLASLDQQTGTILTQVSALTKSIADLNRQIESTSPVGDAGTLEDQRQQDLLQLSQLIGIHTIRTEGNGLTVTTSSGAVLVAKDVSISLGTSSVGGITHILSGTTDVTADLAAGGGQLGGILTVRDGDIPALQNSLDQLAYGMSTKINSLNRAGYDANGAPGSDIFLEPTTVSGSAVMMRVTLTDPLGIAAAGASSTPGIGLGSTDNTNAARLANQLLSTITPTETPTVFYSAFATTLGSLISTTTTENTAQQASLTQLQTQRDTLSAVNLDDEASSMGNFQRSYEAAAKVFSILNSVMASALNLGQQTTV